MKSIGLIGCGVIGGALKKAFEDAGISVKVYDKFKHPQSSYQDVIEEQIVFVCVPTPTTDGHQDLSALYEVVGELSKLKFKGVVCVKSTILPGTMEDLECCFGNLILAHNPEFLTERNALDDFKKQKVVPISTPHHQKFELFKQLFAVVLPNAKVTHYFDYKATELGKYIHNCFLATKVAFMNEMHNYAKLIDTNYNFAAEVAVDQGVIGSTHMQVPGPDGRFGFGGMCFTKDTQALLSTQGELKVLTILDQAVKSNKKIRSE